MSKQEALKKHSDFETSLAAQDVKFFPLDEFAKVKEIHSNSCYTQYNADTRLLGCVLSY